MTDETLRTQVALTKKDTKHLCKTFDEFKGDLREFKQDIKEFKDEIRRSFATKWTAKLEIREALEVHEKEDHKSGPLSSNKIITALIILGATAAGGAGGHTIKEILAALLGG